MLKHGGEVRRFADVSYQTQELASALRTVANEVKPNNFASSRLYGGRNFQKRGVQCRTSPPYISSARIQLQIVLPPFLLSETDRKTTLISPPGDILSGSRNVVAVAVVADGSNISVSNGKAVKEYKCQLKAIQRWRNLGHRR